MLLVIAIYIFYVRPQRTTKPSKWSLTTTNSGGSAFSLSKVQSLPLQPRPAGTASSSQRSQLGSQRAHISSASAYFTGATSSAAATGGGSAAMGGGPAVMGVGPPATGGGTVSMVSPLYASV